MTDEKRKILSDPELAAYEKIRAFVIGQVAKAGDKSMRLASYRQLASRFGVTQTTVMKALKDLITDGFLTIKPGIGTFTCPKKLNYTDKTRLIGCFGGDGKRVFFGRYQWQVISKFADAILRSSQTYQIQNCFVDSSELSAEHISRLGLDGILWFEPSQEAKKVLRELRESGMPCLCAGAECQGVSSYSFGNQILFEATIKMLEEGRRRIMLIVPPEHLSSELDPLSALKKAHQKFNLKYDESFAIQDSEKNLRDFNMNLDRIKPDGVIFCYWGLHIYLPLIKQKIDIEKECRIFCEETSIHNDSGFSGWTTRLKLDKDAEDAAANFNQQFNDPKSAEVLRKKYTMSPIESY